MDHAHHHHHVIPPRSGDAFEMKAGQTLTVIDALGAQVADLLAVSAADKREMLSSGRTLDYAERIYLTTGDKLYSNRSNVMLEIVEDDVGRHDFLLTPCSEATFRMCYDNEPPHRGCLGNLAAALKPYGIEEDEIPIAFNCFMNVPVDGETGKFKVLPPLSKAGDRIVFVAKMDLIIGLTACSAPASNGGSFKPIHYEVR
ncbi:urea carboxylase-associated family protein [Tianweitania sp. BSSL-BM11]|uniref:Urea carboxylase-associated family protein n=1 Tax=Tianweitania aestuarii TaxID=2814886 RepID=A0ABS5S0F9_9HYPH|nr:urea carboxylase-associated family protein [Tianweitania aestuarii]MBS9722026.1 urea carboxylase-associated family protein [Tianweitania aestuarii]